MIWVLHGQAGPPLCMDRPSSLFLRFFCQVVCHALQRHTAPSLHLPLFLEETFCTVALCWYTSVTCSKWVEGGPTVSVRCWQVCVSLLFSFHAAEEVLEKYRDDFIEYVDPDAVVNELYHKIVIPQWVQARIATMHSCREKNQILHQHLVKNSTREKLADACGIIIAEAKKGYPNMEVLGENMKKMLEPSKNLEISSAWVCVCDASLYMFVYVCTCQCACVHVFASMHICVCVVYVCMALHTCTHIHLF